MNAPTFSLPPCPLCSNNFRLERPIWKHAKATSAKRGHSCYLWMGCRHAEAAIDPRKIRDDANDWALCEDVWSVACATMFAEKTEKWPTAARDKFAHALGGRFELAGQKRMDLPE